MEVLLLSILVLVLVCGLCVTTWLEFKRQKKYREMLELQMEYYRSCADYYQMQVKKEWF